MEKLQTLAWIALGLVVFIWRMIQKARATTEREQRERRFTRPDPTGRPRPVTPSLPATSFEELLRQMQAQNNSAPSAPPATPPAAPDAETTPAGRPLPREQAPVARSLEQEKRNARSLERQANTARSLEVQRHEARLAASLPRAVTQHEQDDYWSQQQARRARPGAPRPLTDRLKNPEDVRAAFILSEILQRKF